jgi:Tfp pilus assembly protein FimT
VTRRAEAGLTLVELLLVLALAAVSLLIALDSFSVWNGREEMRGSVYTIQTFLHLAQAEAATRSRDCRFLVDTASRQIQVVDLNGTASTTDDIVVTSAKLPAVVTFADPSGGTPVTLELQSGTTYGTTFSSDGAVSAGEGVVCVSGNNLFSRVTVYGAGGTRVERWDGSAWNQGS